MCRRKLMAVEMEAAALYAFAQVRQKPVLCFAHVTNPMGRIDGDFEKGEADGSHDALHLIAIAGNRPRSRVLPWAGPRPGSCAGRRSPSAQRRGLPRPW